VLAASINRGISTRLEPKRGSKFKLFCLKVLLSIGSPVGFAWKDALAGSAFVTNLRLAWMRTMAEVQADDPSREPEVVQLLGTKDGLVRQEDSRDIEQFPRAAQVPIAGAAHTTVLDISGPSGDDRYILLRANMLRTPEPTQPEPPPEGRAADLVFVVHGIRAGVFGWVPDLRKIIVDQRPDWRVVMPTYRFFSALAFAFPVTRRRKVRWFLDQYSREFAQHPTARFHFVGHSNGTYLLGRSLSKVPGIRFDRVYLAGSVLPADFPWQRFLASRQISAIRSDCGRRDLPVALLSQGLRGLRMRDIGGGGFEGFADLNAPPAGVLAVEMRYFKGGHGAPLKTADRRWRVARYIMTGQAERPADLIETPGWLGVVSRAAPLLVLLVAAGIVASVVWLIVDPGPGSIAVAASIAAALVLLTFV
jgi:hypothetical protein